jgi:hypothetical protein
MEKLIDKLLDIVAENAHPIDNSLDYDELKILFKKEITEQLNLACVTQLRGQLKAFCEYIFKHYRVGNEALIDGFMDEFKSL